MQSIPINGIYSIQFSSEFDKMDDVLYTTTVKYD